MTKILLLCLTACLLLNACEAPDVCVRWKRERRVKWVIVNRHGEPRTEYETVKYCEEWRKNVR